MNKKDVSKKAKKIILKLGYTCNNNCLICHAYHNRSIPDLKTSSAKMKIKLAKKHGASMVIFSGGEPTIRKDIIELSEFAKSLGMDVGIATNGRLFSYSEFSNKIKNNGLKYAYVSLYGTKPIHEKTTKVKGSFDQTIEGINNLLEQGIDTIINIVVSKLNVNHIKETLDMLNNELKKQKNIKIKLSFVNSKGLALKNQKIIPKISYSAERMIEALKHGETLGFNVFLADLPACMTTGFEKNIDTFEKNDITHMSEADENNLFEIDTNEKKYSKKCVSCSKRRFCGGIFKEYLKLYGDAEIKPVGA